MHLKGVVGWFGIFFNYEFGTYPSHSSGLYGIGYAGGGLT